MAKQQANFTINAGEVFYNVANKTFLTKRSRENLDGYNPEVLASIAMNGDDEDLNQIKYSFLSAIGNLKTRLAEYTQGTTGATIVTKSGNEVSLDTGVFPNTVKIMVEMPGNYDTSLIEAVGIQAYNYCVNTCCGDWFAITSPNDATNYYSTASNNLDEIRLTVNRRKRPTRSNFTS